jgi:hypothetical protein
MVELAVPTMEMPWPSSSLRAAAMKPALSSTIRQRRDTSLQSYTRNPGWALALPGRLLLGLGNSSDPDGQDLPASGGVEIAVGGGSSWTLAVTTQRVSFAILVLSNLKRRSR